MIFKAPLAHLAKVTRSLKASLRLYKADSSNDASYTWNTVQNKLTCCGVDGPSDWQHVGLQTPQSCNIENFENDLGYEYRSMPGCYTALKTVLIENMTSLGLAGAGALGLQLGFTVLACHLARGMGEK